MRYDNLPPKQLVDLLAEKSQRNAAIVALLGGITSTELRRVQSQPGSQTGAHRRLKTSE